jgi:hexulose-6-phosphate isomerase
MGTKDTPRMQTFDRRLFLAGGAAAALGSLGLAAKPSLGRAAQDGQPSRDATASDAKVAKPRAKLRPAIKYSMIELDGSVLQRFQLAKECGFEGVELDSPIDIDRQAVVEASKSTGVKVHGVIDSVHWSKPFSHPSAAVRAEALKALEGAIDDAALWGADTVLVVPAVVVANDPEQSWQKCWDRSIPELRKVLPRCEQKGIKLAVEVVWNNFLTKPEQLVQYVDAFQSPQVGAYFDASNMIKYGVSSADWIRALGKRMLKLDFKGYSTQKGWCDIGEGDEDWPRVLEACHEVGYFGWATAEVGGGGKAHLQQVKARMDRILAT